MKRKVFTISFLLCATLLGTQAFARTVYVKLAADATAWSHIAAGADNVIITVSTDFATDIVPNLQASDEIWVAKGEYTLSAQLVLENSWKLYGGFAGTESAVSGRTLTDADGNGLTEKWEFANETKFKGWGTSGTPATATANTSVLRVKAASIVDGVIISDHYINTSSNVSGGGIFAENAETDTDPAIIRNCIVRDITAFGNQCKGAGIFASRGATVENCLIENCQFPGTTATSVCYGGGILATKLTVVRNCVIRNNSVGLATNSNTGRGGGIFMSAGATIENCVINNNTATNQAGGFYIHNEGDNDKQVTRIINCTVVNNFSPANAGILSGNKYIEIYNCVVWGNSLAAPPTSNNNYGNTLRLNAVSTDFPWMDGLALGGTIQGATNNKNTSFSYLDIGGAPGQTLATPLPGFKNPTTFVGVASNATEQEAVEKANWSLLETSVLKNAGIAAPSNPYTTETSFTPASVTFSATDIMGTLRSSYDLGAYEYDPSTGIGSIKDSPFTVYAGAKTIVIDNLKSGAEINVYGVNGVLVSKVQANSGQITIPVSGKGVYLVKITSGNGAYVSKAVVK